MQVYPRLCGGTILGKIWKESDGGLSPPVRGNPGLPGVSLNPLGSIPACAGEPYRAAEAGRRGAVYPRLCGGTLRNALNRLRTQGLSPPVRGNPQNRRRVCGAGRSIPACAGEPCQHNGKHCGRTVYPRLCGGTRRGEGWDGVDCGLSPPVRGNLAGRGMGRG